jgi:hypothetical protein
MDKEFLNFLKDAYSNGLCKEYRDEIRNCHEDKLQLVRLAMRQQSCPWVATKMYEGVITTDYILNTFGEYLNGYVLKDCDNVVGYNYMWFVGWDYTNDIVASADVLHISHTVGANIVVPQTKAPTIYISNHSNVSISCEGFNSIRVYLFDESRVVIDDADETCDVVVYKYSNRADVDTGKFCFANVKIFLKTLRL